MNRIEINTDGACYKQLVRLHEEQIENLKQYEEREKKAHEARNKSVWDTITSYQKTPAEAAEQADELLRSQGQTELEYRAAIADGMEESTWAATTAVALVAELLHDNIDTLDGERLNSKAVFLALNEALPEDIYIATNKDTEDPILYVESGADSLRMCQQLQPCNADTHIRPCRTGSDIISKQRYLNDYDQGVYNIR